jgi:hypothetical protein
VNALDVEVELNLVNERIGPHTRRQGELEQHAVDVRVGA